MPFYKLLVSYDGSRFNGFQRQITNGAMESRASQSELVSVERRASSDKKDTTPVGSAPAQQSVRAAVPKRPHWESSSGRKKRVACTVQDCIEDAIRLWTGQTVEEIGLRFAGRTDAGVHARGQVVRVALSFPHQLSQEGGKPKQWETFEIQNAINSRLPIDISVVQTEQVSVNELGEPLFDPRQDAVCKQYSYTIKFRRKVVVPGAVEDCGQEANARRLLPICAVGPNSFRHAFDSPCCWVVPWPLNDSKMLQLCSFLSGRHNFVAFVHKENRRAEGHVCTLDKTGFEIVSETREDAPVVTARLVFEAKGFQRSMVRNLVGFCVDVCRGLPEVSGSFDWDDIWSEQSALKVHAAPACGLCLEWVQY